MNKIKLKPCPFCGGKGHMVSRYTKKDRHMYYVVRCKCHKSPRWFRKPETAARAWNGDLESEVSK